MHCAIHVDVPASGICTRCDQPTCEACSQEDQGKRFCPSCAAFLAQRNASRPAARPAPAPPPPPAAPPAAMAPQPAAAPPSPVGASPEAEVYDVFTEDVYQGPLAAPAESSGATAAGEVYEAPAPDLYRAPPPERAPTAMSSLGPGDGAASANGSTGRAILFGLGLGLVAAYVWYGVSIATNWKLGPIAAVVGAVVGWATAAGAGRQESDVGLLAVVLALLSMTTGEYLIWDHVLGEFAQEESSYTELMLEIGADRRYTASELERFYAFGEDVDDLTPFQNLSDDDRRELRAWADEEYLRLSGDTAALEPARLSMGDFFGYLAFDIWNAVFFFIGCGAAYRMASGTGDD